MSPTKYSSTFLNIKRLLSQSIRSDFLAVERLLTPLFLGAIVLILFSFAIPELAEPFKSRILAAESQLSVFFALQVAFSRVFDNEKSDRVFDYMRVAPISHNEFLVAKLLHVLLWGAFTFFFTSLFATFLQGLDRSDVLAWPFILNAVLALLGLASLGVLLATVTLRSDNHQVLFPILYFPLSAPVLLGSTENISLWLSSRQWTGEMDSWFIVLLSFDAIYLTMAFLFGPSQDI